MSYLQHIMGFSGKKMLYTQKQFGINMINYSFSEFTQKQRIFLIFLPFNVPQDKNPKI